MVGSASMHAIEVEKIERSELSEQKTWNFCRNFSTMGEERAEENDSDIYMPLNVLVVDDDVSMRSACCRIAAATGSMVFQAANLAEAQRILKQQEIDFLLLDLKLPDGTGLPLLQEVKTSYPKMVVVIMTAFATVTSAVEAMRTGAKDYLTKPFDMNELMAVLENAGSAQKFAIPGRISEKPSPHKELVGQSPEMMKLYRIISKVALSPYPILIQGERGTGKETIARCIHRDGPNAAFPFVPIHCGSFPPGTIESELFGYTKGAFDGANSAKEGLLASIEGGTVFLDEIDELPLDLQAKLLRSLQEKEVRPIGASRARRLSVRVLAATNRDLHGMVEQGKFRKDLFFRLSVVNLKVPPLRDRKEDISLLTTYFLRRVQQETKRSFRLSEDVLDGLARYDWPGNVRELESVIERACTLSSRPLLRLEDLLPEAQVLETKSDLENRKTDEDSSNLGGARTEIVSISEMERHAIIKTLQHLNGDKLRAAQLLGIGKTTLYRKLKEYGVPA